MSKLNFASIVSLLLMSACGGSGPSVVGIVDGAHTVVGGEDVAKPQAERFPYVLVEVDRDIARNVTESRRRIEAAAFHGLGSPTNVVIGRGDVVQVSIISANETGYVDFTTASIAPINQTSLVPQQVGRDGQIRVPPLGPVQAAGLTVDQFEQNLTDELSEVLVDPAAIVEIVDRQSAKVSVVGKVDVPGRYAIDDASLRLLDMIALAEGPTDRSENLRVRLSRNGITRTALMESVLGNPSLNVYVRSGDVIEVESPENRITVLGSGASENETLLFNRPDDTLVEVLGGAGGLANRTADRKGVFLYRDTPKETIASLGVNTLYYQHHTVPTIYRFDLTRPDALFAAKSFEVADGDILYLATSFKDAVEAFYGLVPLQGYVVGDVTVGF